MPKILVIDDEKIFHNMIRHAVEPQGYQVETAFNGLEGIEKARIFQPDIIITDVMMPDMNGYEVTSALRREPTFAHIPILVLTAQSDLQAKIKSFEAGADDHLTKPFNSEELSARLQALMRRAEWAKTVQRQAASAEKAKLIAVHSLRGGTGCSSVAVNLAVSMARLWSAKTLLIDLAMTAGQVALMLNAPLKRTWADLARFTSSAIDSEAINSVIAHHDSGLSFIPAPTFPAEAEALDEDTLNVALEILLREYDYIIADLPHDFSPHVISALDKADQILLLVAPEMASIRAAAAALDTYAKLDYPTDKIMAVLNATFPRSGLSRSRIETAISTPITVTIPYLADQFVHAINYGKPLVENNPESSIAGLFEDFSFHLSKESHKKEKPQQPSEAWLRVYKRFMARR